MRLSWAAVILVLYALGAAAIVSGFGRSPHATPGQLAIELYGCIVKQQLPSGDCP